MPTDPILEKLDEISAHLKHLDSRDRWRMIGGAIRSLINIGFLVFVVWSSWYLIAHMEDFIRIVTQEAGKMSQQMMRGGSDDVMKQVQQMLKK